LFNLLQVSHWAFSQEASPVCAPKNGIHLTEINEPIVVPIKRVDLLFPQAQCDS